jgi:hypothetical protein
VLVAEDGLFANLHDVEDGITCCQEHLWLLVIQTFDHWGQDFVKVLGLLLVEQGYGDDRETVEATPSLLGIVSFHLLLHSVGVVRVNHRCKVSDTSVDRVVLVLVHQTLDILLKLLGSLLTLFNRPKG